MNQGTAKNLRRYARKLGIEGSGKFRIMKRRWKESNWLQRTVEMRIIKKSLGAR